jgi:hypothetical protein
MTVGYTLWSMFDGAFVASTARDRWEGLRQVSPRAVEDYSSLVAIGLLLSALILLLWWVTHKDRAVARSPARDLLSEGAARRGLSPRERQILLAIVVRSKLRRSHDIFTTPDAFNIGAAKLLEECARTRTPQECDRLSAEVAGLRESIGYRAATGGVQTRAGSSRSIPVGATIELLRRRDPGSTPLVSEPGEPWRVRYHLDGIVWQFDTSAVTCEDNRLVLNHPEQVRVMGRGNGDRLVINAPAAVAKFPFIQSAPAESLETAPLQWFELVDGVVTQMSDGGLQISSSLSVRPGDRVLLVFASGGTLMTVELADVADHEIDELLRLAKACASRAANAPAGLPVRQGV